jgi:hypothetical protein
VDKNSFSYKKYLCGRFFQACIFINQYIFLLRERSSVVETKVTLCECLAESLNKAALSVVDNTSQHQRSIAHVIHWYGNDSPSKISRNWFLILFS